MPLPVPVLAHEDRTEPRWRRPVVLIGIAAIAVAYFPVVSELVALWRGDKYYPYLGLIPPLFVLMLWTSRDRRLAAAGHGTPVGLPLIVAALALLALGRAASTVQLQSLSLVIAVVGIAVWVRGLEWARAAAYPLAFLLLLVPVPRGWFDEVTLDVQRLLTRHAGAILDSSGIPVRMEELAIHLPTVTLEIAEACNGLRFLTVLVVFTAGAAGLVVPSVAGRVLLIALAIPAAFAANIARITGLGLAAHWFGSDAVKGEPHYLIGWTAWAVTVASLLVVAWLLRRLSAPPGEHAGVPSHRGRLET